MVWLQTSNMKASSFFLISLVSLLSLSASASTVDSFLQCLLLHDDQISAVIYTPNNSSFVWILRAYERNARFITGNAPEPLVIVTAMKVSHIQATIICSKAHGLILKTRSGGHDYEGLSYTANLPFVILDICNLRSISIDIENQTAWIQSGATLGELYYYIAQKSKILAFPAGVCSTVGAGGHFSGAGYGNLMRKYGLSVDNIVDAQLVDVDGRILNRESMGKDLFWAIRGGGGSNFGVIFSWKLNLVSVPDPVTVFQVVKTLEQGATDLVFKWQKVAAKLPNELFLRVEITAVNGSEEGEKTVQVSFTAQFLGNAQELLLLMKKWFPELGLKQSDCIEMPWINSTVYWDRFPRGSTIDILLDRTQFLNKSSKFKSDFVLQPISKAGLEIIWKKVIELENIGMQWSPLGGRVSEISVSATPYPHRKALFKIEHSTQWEGGTLQISEYNVNLVRKLYETMTPFVSNSPRQAFLNYRDLDIGSSPFCNATFEEAKRYGTKYFLNNYERLVRVKTKVDPHNFFRDEQSIPPRPRCTALCYA